jgi:hypothetical protein
MADEIAPTVAAMGEKLVLLLAEGDAHKQVSNGREQSLLRFRTVIARLTLALPC